MTTINSRLVAVLRATLDVYVDDKLITMLSLPEARQLRDDIDTLVTRWEYGQIQEASQ